MFALATDMFGLASKLYGLAVDHVWFGYLVTEILLFGT